MHTRSQVVHIYLVHRAMLKRSWPRYGGFEKGIRAR